MYYTSLLAVEYSGKRGELDLEIRYKDIGHRIRQRRKSKKLTQQQLAELANMEPSNLSHIELGTTKASLQSLLNLAASLDCSLDDIVCDSLPRERGFYLGELETLVSSCTPTELRVITATLKPLVESLRVEYKEKDG